VAEKPVTALDDDTPQRLGALEAAVEASAEAMLAEVERLARRGDANMERVIRAVVDVLTRQTGAGRSSEAVSLNQIATDLARAALRGGRFR
jgi:hypothetical protein